MIKSFFYLIVVVATMLVAMLSFPLLIIGYILLLAYALIKG
jgi:hypothetical protein